MYDNHIQATDQTTSLILICTDTIAGTGCLLKTFPIKNISFSQEVPGEDVGQSSAVEAREIYISIYSQHS